MTDEYFTSNITETNLSNSKDLLLENFSIEAYKNKLFVETSLKIPFGTRACIIARNGYGKTTLLTHISKRLLPVHPDMDLLHVDQEIYADNRSVIETILSANEHRQNLLKRVDEENYDDYIKIQEEMKNIDSDKDESIVKKILYGLGFSFNDFERPTIEFSGGWRMRIALAKALYMRPTLLILDEPTNHLDLNAVIWLSQYLKAYPKSLLLVSHNQQFLSEVCNCVIQIENKKLVSYHGTYEAFVIGYHQKREIAEGKWEKLEKQISQMKRSGKSKEEIANLIKKKDEEGIVKPDKEYIVKVQFYNVLHIDIPVISVKNVSFGYPDKQLFKNVNIEIGMATRCVIVGCNGIGKTTFFNLLVGDVKPDVGTIEINNIGRIAYYNQHFIDHLPLHKTCIEYIKDTSILQEEENTIQNIRGYLGNIGLEGNKHLLTIDKLSGGQKARVAFVSLFVQKPHVILLDEPTNHLDIESINGLIKGINEFNGGVVMISHDAELITKTGSKLMICEHMNVNMYPGNYDDYKISVTEQN